MSHCPLFPTPQVDGPSTALSPDQGPQDVVVGDALREYMLGIDRRVQEAAARIDGGGPFDVPLVPGPARGARNTRDSASLPEMVGRVRGAVEAVRADVEDEAGGVGGAGGGRAGGRAWADQMLLEDLVVYNALETALIEARGFLHKEGIPPLRSPGR